MEYFNTLLTFPLTKVFLKNLILFNTSSNNNLLKSKWSAPLSEIRLSLSSSPFGPFVNKILTPLRSPCL